MNPSTVLIALDNPKSPDNVNAIMRSAGNFGVEAVFYTGKRYPRALMRNPSIVDMRRKVGTSIPLTAVDSVFDVVQAPMQTPMQALMQVVCVEFAEGAIALPTFQHPPQALYVFGPEDGTLSQAIIDRADAVVYVPTIGCMNLSASVNVLLYDRLLKSYQGIEENSLIRQSRDINNNRKVKYTDQ